MYKALPLLMAVALGSALPLAAAPALAQITWDERFYNPEPEPDDFILPMPCGGAMAFRRVGTPASENLLEDYQITLGQAGDSNAISDYVRQAYILGSLTSTLIAGRVAYFYMGKYEVTRDQYEAVMGDGCPRPNMGGRRPVSEVSWFDAVAFTRAYTEWLYENEPDSLPTEGDSRAFIRLPTEVEWEYAARGGNAVDPNTEFRQPLFPMPAGGLQQYVWFQGPRSAAGELHPVGLLEPNPLGLYDMLGNAEELVFDPYHINRVGRTHGQVGGFVTRGGSYQTPAAGMSTARRVEYPYFDERTGRARQLPTFGFRVVVSAPVLVDQQRITELREAWEQARRMRTAEQAEDPLGTLDELISSTTDLELRARLEGLAQRFSREVAARNEVEGRALRSAIVSGAVLIRMLRNDHRLIESVRRLYEYERSRDPESEQTRQRGDQLAAMEERFDITLRAYFNGLVQAADDYRPDQLRQQLGVQIQSFEGSDLDTLVEPAQTFIDQALAFAESRDLDQDLYLQQILQ